MLVIMNESNEPKHPIKSEGYLSGKLWAKRERKAAEAFERQSRWNRTPLAEKVKMIKGRRGNSKKELGRLTKKKS